MRKTLFALLFLFPCTAQAWIADDTGTVRGVVLGPDGEPAAGARVSFDWWYCVGHADRKGQVTDRKGRFRFENVRLRGPVYAAAPDQGLGLAHTRRTGPMVLRAGEEVTLGLPRAATLTGRILDESGPVRRDASIYVRGAALGLAVHMPPVRTNEQGRYEVRGIPTGKYTVTVLASPRAPGQRHDLQFERGERRTADLPLQEARMLKGRVMDDRGRPVAGARIVLLLPGLEIDLGTRTTHTNPEGSFRIRAGAGDEYELRVRRIGIAPLSKKLSWPEGELQVDVQSLGSISGRVALDDPDTPAREYSVHVFATGSESPVPTWVSPPNYATFEHAAFQFPNIAPGVYDVIVLAKGRASRRINGIRVEGGRDTALGQKLVLEETGRVEGKVLDANGKPLNNVAVRIESPDGSRASGWGTRSITGSAGIYQLWLLHPGRCIVRATHEGRAITRAVTVTARAKVEIDLRIE